MNLFFDIPKVHQVDLLAEWLQPEDVAKLDVAVACHKHRKELTDLLSSPECVLGMLEYLHKGTTEWIISRQVKVCGIAMYNKDLADGEAVEKLVKVIGPTLKALDYYCSIQNEEDLDDDESIEPLPISMDQVLYHFIRNMTCLESLKLCDGAVDGMVSALISCNKHTLKSFELSKCSNVSASILKACCDSPCLENLVICTCEFTDDALRFFAKTNTTVRKLTFSGALNSVQVLNYVGRFSNLRYVEAHLGDVELALASKCCKLVEHAKITVSTPLTLPFATEVTQNWKHIVQLEILPSVPETHVCNQNVMLLFVHNCLTLQQLVLAPPKQIRIDDIPFEPIATSVDASRLIHSNLTELTVSYLSKNLLEAVIEKCPELRSLCINRPIPSYMGSLAHEHAEFSLDLLNHTKVIHLSLSYCMDFTLQQLSSLHNLEKLELYNMGNPMHDLGDHEMIQFVQQCPNLHTLHLHHCPFFDYHTVLPLLHAAPKLVDFEYTAVGADNRPGLSPTELVLQEVMQKLFPRLVYFEMRS